MQQKMEFTLSVDQMVEINEQFYRPKTMAITLLSGVAIIPLITLFGEGESSFAFVLKLWLISGICALLCVGMYFVVHRRTISRIIRTPPCKQLFTYDNNRISIETIKGFKSEPWENISKAVILPNTIIVFSKRGVRFGLPCNNEIINLLSTKGCKVKNMRNA